MAVDPVIPFALGGNNDLWNLLPAHSAVNGQKSDKLPLGDLLIERRDAIVDNWTLLRDALPDAFDRQALTLIGRGLTMRLREAVEMTAVQRGVERWRRHALGRLT